MNNYVPFDVFSSYSIGNSICQIPRLVRTARVMGIPALALTDRNCMYGVAEFHAACRSQRTSVYGALPPIKPIIGQATITTIHGENHLIRLLAKDKTGYRNLVRISSAERHPKRSKYRLIPFSDIEKWSDGLICMTNETTPDFVNECLRVFGDDFAFMADSYFIDYDTPWQTGIRGFLKDAPDLLAAYKTLMRYKKLSTDFRDAIELYDPNSASLVFDGLDEPWLVPIRERAHKLLDGCERSFRAFTKRIK